MYRRFCERQPMWLLTTSSPLHCINNGVPQGSVLYATLFLLKKTQTYYTQYHKTLFGKVYLYLNIYITRTLFNLKFTRFMVGLRSSFGQTKNICSYYEYLGESTCCLRLCLGLDVASTYEKLQCDLFVCNVFLFLYKT